MLRYVAFKANKRCFHSQTKVRIVCRLRCTITSISVLPKYRFEGWKAIWFKRHLRRNWVIYIFGISEFFSVISYLPPTLIPLSRVSTTCISSCCDKDYFYDRPPARRQPFLKLEWVLTIANATGTNVLTCLPKHGGARDNKFWSPILWLAIETGA
jgi:hypothetical protein